MYGEDGVVTVLLCYSDPPQQFSPSRDMEEREEYRFLDDIFFLSSPALLIHTFCVVYFREEANFVVAVPTSIHPAAGFGTKLGMVSRGCRM